eukprot:TRINITY_DN25170_c0_g1_i1.p1 TRINITY_DN25170_c0_g1~~TRINITY_DN25170_c0_g1_i1.p1  ORF type:complete len:804 (-),score=272.06 TRINITY_DN25170_c0_g1_i1:152-2563(-)
MDVYEWHKLMFQVKSLKHFSKVQEKKQSLSQKKFQWTKEWVELSEYLRKSELDFNLFVEKSPFIATIVQEGSEDTHMDVMRVKEDIERRLRKNLQETKTGAREKPKKSVPRDRSASVFEIRHPKGLKPIHPYGGPHGPDSPVVRRRMFQDELGMKIDAMEEEAKDLIQYLGSFSRRYLGDEVDRMHGSGDAGKWEDGDKQLQHQMIDMDERDDGDDHAIDWMLAAIYDVEQSMRKRYRSEMRSILVHERTQEDEIYLEFLESIPDEERCFPDRNRKTSSKREADDSSEIGVIQPRLVHSSWGRVQGLPKASGAAFRPLSSRKKVEPACSDEMKEKFPHLANLMEDVFRDEIEEDEPDSADELSQTVSSRSIGSSWSGEDVLSSGGRDLSKRDGDRDGNGYGGDEEMGELVEDLGVGVNMGQEIGQEMGQEMGHGRRGRRIQEPFSLNIGRKRKRMKRRQVEWASPTGCWEENDHFAFWVAYREHMQGAGDTRTASAFRDRVQMFVPSKSIEEIMMHDVWFRHYTIMRSKMRSLRRDVHRQLSTLRSTINREIVKAADRIDFQRLKDLEERETRERLKLLHDKVDAMHRIRFEQQLEIEAMQEEDTLAHQLREESFRKLEIQRRTRIQELLEEYRAEKEEQAARELEIKRLEEESKLERDQRKKIVNRGRVEYRREIQKRKQEERKRELEFLRQEAHRKQKRLEKIMEEVRVEVERDPDRAIGDTIASEMHMRDRVDPSHLDDRVFNPVFGYREDDLFRDKRFRLQYELGNAGLLGKQTAVDALRTMSSLHAPRRDTTGTLSFK